MYSQITANKRKTWLLVSLVTGFIVLLFYFFGLYLGTDPAGTIIVGTIFATVYSLISYFLADKVALATHGAKELKKVDGPELWNLVENLTIASGLPMPKIYLIADDSPNAFATGRDPKHASVTFTTGLLRLLDKQELEGVIAHELSHIKNYDIRLMTITVVLVGVVMLMAQLMIHIRPPRGNNDNNQAGLIFLLIGIALAILSPLIAELIKLAISRTREYLADADASLLTRFPEGLANALRKIEAAQIGQPLKTANQATAHLFISNPFGSGNKKWLANAFSTHPPTNERIARLTQMGS